MEKNHRAETQKSRSSPHPQPSALTVMEHFLIHKISEETRNSALLPTHVIFHLCFFIIIGPTLNWPPRACPGRLDSTAKSHHMPASQRRVKIFYGGQMVSHCLIFSLFSSHSKTHLAVQWKLARKWKMEIKTQRRSLFPYHSEYR